MRSGIAFLALSDEALTRIWKLGKIIRGVTKLFKDQSIMSITINIQNNWKYLSHIRIFLPLALDPSVRVEGGETKGKPIKITYSRTCLTKIIFFLPGPQVPQSWTKQLKIFFTYIGLTLSLTLDPPIRIERGGTKSRLIKINFFFSLNPNVPQS